MRSEFTTVRLGDLCEIIMGQSPKSEFYNTDGMGLPFLQGNRTFGDKYPTFDTYTTSVTKVAEASDVIMSVRAPVGDVNITPVKLCLGRGVCALRHKNGAQEFLYYLMRYYSNELINRESGTVFGSVNRDDIFNLEVSVPPLKEQLVIGHVLSTIDDKIAINNAINQHLEQIAQAIFKSWFVDFEPFGGKIPNDWKTESLDEVANYLNGLAMQKFRPSDGEAGLPVLKIRELRMGQCDASSELCSVNIPADYIVHDGDVIFSWSGSLLVDFWCGGDCGLNQHLFKVTSDRYDKWFYYLWTNYHLKQFIDIAEAKATTMGHIKRQDLKNAKVIVPDEECYSQIGNLLTPLYNQIINNRIQNRKLTQLRDCLLPRLMSGELSIEETDFL